MNTFKQKNLTTEELLLWNQNKLINPRTNRVIKINSKLYNFIQEEYNKVFPNKYNLFDSIDERDPISLIPFYTYKDKKKVLLYNDISKLIIYRENSNIVRCLEKSSLEYMKAYGIKEHPVSQQKIPDEIFNSIERIKLNDEENIKEKALQVFQLFTNISIFIDYEGFLKLDKKEMLTLNYEIKSFYYENLNIDQRSKIDKKNGESIFYMSNDELSNYDIIYIKNYILDNIKILLECQNDDLKYMINYIILGGLSLVLNEVKEYYDNFNFSF